MGGAGGVEVPQPGRSWKLNTDQIESLHPVVPDFRAHSWKSSITGVNKLSTERSGRVRRRETLPRNRDDCAAYQPFRGRLGVVGSCLCVFLLPYSSPVIDSHQILMIKGVYLPKRWRIDCIFGWIQQTEAMHFG